MKAFGGLRGPEDTLRFFSVLLLCGFLGKMRVWQAAECWCPKTVMKEVGRGKLDKAEAEDSYRGAGQIWFHLSSASW